MKNTTKAVFLIFALLAGPAEAVTDTLYQLTSTATQSVIASPNYVVREMTATIVQ